MRALDTETFLIIPGLATPKLVCGQVADATSERLLYPSQVRDAILDHADCGEELAAANGVYDFGVACALYLDLIPAVFSLYERGLIRDTHVRQPLLDLGRGTLLLGANGEQLQGYSLSNISEKVLALSLAKENTPRLFYARLDGVPHEMWSDEQRSYALKDARRTYDVVVAQGRGVPGDLGIENLKLEVAECRAAWALHLMRCWGVRTDKEMVADVTREVTAAHEAAVAKFTEAGIYRGEGWCRRKKQCEGTEPHKFHPERWVASPGCWKPWLSSAVGTRDGAVLKELVRRAYMGEPPTTDTGDIATNRDTLLESGDELLMALGETGTDTTAHNVFLDVIARGVEVPISVEYDLIKRTTRTGSSNPNLQNLPRKGRVRECFVARPGYVWCSVDMPSLELVTLAQKNLRLFKQSAMADYLRRGMDLHVLLASRAERIDYEEAHARYKNKDLRIKDLRQAMKPVNYGLGGGMGAAKLVIYARQPSNGGVRFCLVAGASKCGERKHMHEDRFSGKKTPVCTACVEAAEKFRQLYLDTYPEMRDYFDYVGDLTEVPEDAVVEVEGPPGEPTLYVRGRGFSEAANLGFQAPAARMMKDALWRVAKASYVDKTSPLFNSRPCLFIHDEIMCEALEDRMSEAAEEQARLMNAAAAHWCPDVPCVAEPALMRRWFKGAEQASDSNGCLRPWWPRSWAWAADLELMQRDRRGLAA